MTVERVVTIHPVDPPGGPYGLPMGDGPPQVSGGSGGWAERERPRRTDLMEWTRTPPYRLAVPALIEAPNSDVDDIEAAVSALRGLGRVVPGGYQTPVLRLEGPIPLTDLRWVIEGIEDGPFLRREEDGLLVRQFFTVSFVEYSDLDLLVTASPAEAAAARAQPPTAGPATGQPVAARTYTVRSGDTLSAIAARELGDHRRWQEIATLNDVRDPRKLRVGQDLRLP